MTATAAAATVPLGAMAHLIPVGVDLSDPVKGFADVAAGLAGPTRRRWAILVDDLHQLDSASAVLLCQILDVGLVRLIATLRTGEPVGEAVDALCHGHAVHWVEVDVLDEDQVERLLQSTLGGPVARRTLYELFTASGGNVLYLRELVLAALSSGALTCDGEIWELAEDRPTSTSRLAELIGARLASAGPEARPLLELLAVARPYRWPMHRRSRPSMSSSIWSGPG